MNGPTARSDAWQALRKYTPARVALGRAGGSVPTAELLDFAVAHAAARDAVYAPFEAEAVRSQLQRLGLETILLNTQAVDRAVYLRRPNLGRRLEAESRDRLAAAVRGDCDVALVVGDGLSAPAAGRNAATVLEHLLPRLRRESLSVGPACVVRGARVAV